VTRRIVWCEFAVILRLGTGRIALVLNLHEKNYAQGFKSLFENRKHAGGGQRAVKLILVKLEANVCT